MGSSSSSLLVVSCRQQQLFDDDDEDDVIFVCLSLDKRCVREQSRKDGHSFGPSALFLVLRLLLCIIKLAH